MAENQAATVQPAVVIEASRYSNQLFMAGEITKLLANGFELKATLVGKDKQTGQDVPYTEENICILDPKHLAAIGAEVGSRVQFYGFVGQDAQRIKRVYPFAKSLQKTKLPFDANQVDLQGIIGTVVYTEPDSVLKKQGFARATVTVKMPNGSTQGVPIVLFQDMARNWAKTPPGSEVAIGGRMRCRERSNGRQFVNPNGDLTSSRFTEVVCNPSACRIVKRAIVFNPFAGVNMNAFMDEAAEDGPIAGPQPEAEAAAPAPKKPGRPKKQAQAEAAAEQPAF